MSPTFRRRKLNHTVSRLPIRSARARLFLVSLEDRLAPASLVVMDGGDNGGATQLRAIWNTANTNGQTDTITFDPSVTTVTLTSALNTYAEAQNLTITGNGKTVTTINAPNGNRIFNFDVPTTKPTITIAEMSLQGGSTSANGGAILNNDEALVLTNLKFTNNTASAGGAIANSGSFATLKLTGCNFNFNVSSQVVPDNVVQFAGGGGIFLQSDAVVALSNCSFENNVSASSGGAISSLRLTTLTLTSDSTNFTNNQALGTAFGGGGGAIFCDSFASTITIDHAAITGNSSAAHGGALMADHNPQVTIKNSTISSNSSGYYGGAISMRGGGPQALTLVNDVIIGNSGERGGAVLCGSALNVTNSTFTGNISTEWGGAIYVDDGPAWISQSIFGSNSAPFGGAIYSAPDETTSISDCDFSSNSATTDGGAIYHVLGSMELSRCTLRNNSADGNGGTLRTSGNLATVTINQCTFLKNTAKGSSGGGAIYLFGTNTITINNSTIFDNTASGSATTSNGGGVSRNNSGLFVLNSTIIAGNKVTGGGTKGIDLYSSTSVTIAGNNSLIGTNDNSNVTFTGTVQKGTNASPLDPQLNSLTDNGGALLPDGTHPLTMSLKANSPAIDAGNNSAAFTSDGRAGFDRVYGPVADVGAVEAFGKYPHATLVAGNVTTGGNIPYSFEVVYADSSGGNINTATIANGNVTVTGPGMGAGQNPTSFVVSGTGSTVTATYTIPAPTGGWAGTNFGTYTIALNGNQVQDTDDGFYVPTRTLGTFKTAVPSALVVDESSDVSDGDYSAGHLSLRESLQLTNANVGQDTISFGLPAGTTITLTSGLTISDSLALTGPGADKLTINANKTGRHFTLDTPDRNVLISGLTLTGSSVGAGLAGGALLLHNDTVTIDGVWFSGNTAGVGGAISVDSAIFPTTAVLAIRNSTFSANSAISGGAIAGMSTLTLIASNSTFSGNVASNLGGAISGGNSGSILLKNSTVTGNSASKGGGIWVSNYSYSGNMVNLESTVLSGNSATAGPDFLGTQFGYAITAKNSIIGKMTSGKVYDLGANQVGTSSKGIDAKLDPLTFNTGPMPTHRPQFGSPAIDLGSNPDSLTFDQRGTGHPRVYGAAIDIGAYETSHQPSAKLSAPLIAAPNTSPHSFDVIYADLDTNIDTTTLNTADVTVTGTGFGGGQQPTSLSIAGAGKSVTVTYTIPAPAGGWGLNYESYPVMLNALEVFDSDAPSFSVPAGVLGAIQMGMPLVVDELSDLDDSNYFAGHLSLREAIKLSNANSGAIANTINFDSTTFNGATLALSGTINITQSVVINGLGADKLSIDAKKSGRHFTLTAPGINVTLKGLTLTGGSASSGGAILINNDTVTLDGVWLAGNTSSGTGGAIAFNAVSFPSLTTSALLIRNSTLSGNSSTGNGGAIAFLRGSALTISNSTLSTNKTNGSGGAIGGNNSDSAGSIVITNSTITGNSAVLRGGGIRLTDAAYTSGIVSMESTIISGNLASFAGPDFYGNTKGAAITSKNSIIGKMTHGTINDLGGTQSGTASAPLDAKLDPLANYGGPIPTHRLQFGSPAINNGSNPDGLNTDQRGSSYPRTNGLKTDIGAFEFAPPTASVTFGDGSNQRSLVKQIVVTFSEAVNFSPDVASAFTLSRTGSGGSTGNVALTANPVNGPASSVTITFSGSLTENGSLVDGFYDFMISAAQVSGVGGALDGNSDGTPGGSYSVTGTTANKFFRLFGDSDGDATTTLTDFAAFRGVFNLGANTVFDFDNDGNVGLGDFAQFRARFNLSP